MLIQYSLNSFSTSTEGKRYWFHFLVCLFVCLFVCEQDYSKVVDRFSQLLSTLDHRQTDRQTNKQWNQYLFPSVEVDLERIVKRILDQHGQLAFSERWDDYRVIVHRELSTDGNRQHIVAITAIYSSATRPRTALFARQIELCSKHVHLITACTVVQAVI